MQQIHYSLAASCHVLPSFASSDLIKQASPVDNHYDDEVVIKNEKAVMAETVRW